MIRATLLSLITVMSFVPAARSAEDAMKKALVSIPGDALAFVCVPAIGDLDRDFQQIGRAHV